MAIRVALLIIVTGIFVALWSGDRPDPVTEAVPSKQNEEYRQSTPHDGGPISRVPLPQGIVAGTYLVADQSGRTQIRVVGNIQNGTLNSENISNHYSVEKNGARWHFIRLDTREMGRIAKQPSTRSFR